MLGTTFPIPGSSAAIDAVTLIYFRGINGKKVQYVKNPDLDVTVVIPARNEERMIKRCVESLFNQTCLPKKVIIVDDCSQDETPEICRELDKKYLDLIYIRQRKRSGKANNINYAAQLLLTQKELFTDIMVIVDGDTSPQRDFIEQIKKPFVSNDVAAVSGTASIIEPENLKSKAIAGIYRFLFGFYDWQKNAQGYRNAVNPICGGAVAYRTYVLGKIPVPARCTTEDTDHTWLLQEKKYKVIHNPKARIDSEQAKTFQGFLRQWFRWYSGSHQAWFIHGRKLLSAKKLLFTTLLPSALDAWIYSIWLFAFLFLALWDPIWSLWLLALDMGLTGFFVMLVSPRELKYLPVIWIIKFPLALTWIASGLKAMWERLTNKQRSWSKAWERPDHRASMANFSLPTKITANPALHTINNQPENAAECELYKFLKKLQFKSIPDRCLQCRNLIECIKK
jgi:cellulose synthase/poly-beta-1,6-N-acetylglucosamine synthase-like glycosyltransferase